MAPRVFSLLYNIFVSFFRYQTIETHTNYPCIFMVIILSIAGVLKLYDVLKHINRMAQCTVLHKVGVLFFQDIGGLLTAKDTVATDE